MNNIEFEQFVLKEGKDILRFCRVTTANDESGNELYQETMLKLLEKQRKLNKEQNVKAYALSISILLWKNKKKKFAVRNRIAQFSSLDEITEETEGVMECSIQRTPEDEVLSNEEVKLIQSLIFEMPEKYKIPLFLSYSAGMKAEDIAETLRIPLGTAKTRIRKAKALLKEKLEAIGYDR